MTLNIHRRLLLAKIDTDKKYNRQTPANVFQLIADEFSEFRRQYDRGIVLIDMMSMKITNW
jgi:hypothetical protein